MADFYITQGDVGWELQVTIKDADGVVVDVSATTNTFKMKSHTTSTDTINAAATDVDGVNGVIKYVGVLANNALPAGFYDAEFVIDPAGNNIFRAPTRNKILVEIVGKVLA